MSTDQTRDQPLANNLPQPAFTKKAVRVVVHCGANKVTVVPYVCPDWTLDAIWKHAKKGNDFPMLCNCKADVFEVEGNTVSKEERQGGKTFSVFCAGEHVNWREARSNSNFKSNSAAPVISQSGTGNIAFLGDGVVSYGGVSQSHHYDDLYDTPLSFSGGAHGSSYRPDFFDDFGGASVSVRVQGKMHNSPVTVGDTTGSRGTSRSVSVSRCNDSSVKDSMYMGELCKFCRLGGTGGCINGEQKSAGFYRVHANTTGEIVEISRKEFDSQ